MLHLMGAISGQGSQRRRAPNKSKMTTLAEVDPDNVEIPRLPPGLGLTATAKRRWREIHTSPMSAQYVPADLPGIVRLVTLYSMMERTDSTRSLIEISRECRALESEYGCSPKSRSQMKYEVDRGERAEQRSRRRRNVTVVTETDTPNADKPSKGEMLKMLRADSA